MIKYFHIDGNLYTAMTKFGKLLMAFTICLFLRMGGSAEARGNLQSNPQVVRGSSATFLATQVSEQLTNGWVILDAGGASVAGSTSGNTRGWSVTFAGSNFTVGAPTTAVIAANYVVKYRSGNEVLQKATFNVVGGGNVPLAPTGLTAISGNGQVSLTWNASAGATTYILKRSLVSLGPYANVATSLVTTSVVDTALTAGTTYWYVVSASNSSGESPNSTEVSAIVMNTLAFTLIANTVSSSEIDLIWLDPSSASRTGYSIFRRLGASTGSASDYAQVSSAGKYAIKFQDLSPASATNYTYQVRATNGFGTTNEASATTTDVIPSFPTGLICTAPTWDHALLSWNDTSNNELGFKIERSLDGTAFSLLATTGANINSFDDSSVFGAVSYWYRVKSYNLIGDSTASNVATVSTPFPPAPPTPTNLIASSLYEDRVDLTWSNSGVRGTNFRIERKEGPGPFVFLANSGNDTASFSDYSVSPLTAYTYRVMAFNAGGSSGWSNEAVVTTTGIAEPGTVVYLKGMDWQQNPVWGSSAQGTLYFSTTTTSPVSVQMKYARPVSGPAIINVPSGVRSFSFTVSVGPSSELTPAGVTATLGNWSQKEYLAVVPALSALAIQHMRATTGQGAVLLQWASLTPEMIRVIGAYQVVRKRGVVTEILSSSRPSEESFLDLSALSGSVSYKIQTISKSGDVLAESAWIDVAVASGTPTLTGVTILPTPTPGIYNFTVPIAAYATGREARIYRNGNTINILSTPGSLLNPTVITSQLDVTNSAATGPVTICFEDEIQHQLRISPPLAVNYVGTAADDSEDLFDSSEGEFGHIESTFGADASSVSCLIQSLDGVTIRSWTGRGNKFRVAWDGKSDAGLQLESGQYTALLTPQGPKKSPAKKKRMVHVKSPPSYLSLMTLFNGSESEDMQEVHAVRDAFLARKQPFDSPLVMFVREDQTANLVDRKYLVKWFKNPNAVKAFHFTAHGQRNSTNAGDNRFQWGGLQFYPTIQVDPANGYLFDDNYPGKYLSVPWYPEKNSRFQFVFLDICSQFGGDLNDWAGTPQQPLNAQWQYAFGISDPLNQVIMGWNGLAAQNVDPASDVPTSWLKFRLAFWRSLGLGSGVNLSFSRAIPGIDFIHSRLKPYDANRAVIIGDLSNTVGLP